MIVFDKDAVGHFVCSKIPGMKWVPDQFTAVGRQENGRIVAGALYENYNGVNVFIHIAGEGKHFLDNESLFVVFDYPFNQLKVKRITGMISHNNFIARRFAEKMGFQLEHTMKDAAPDGHICIYRMFREDCKYLKDFI